MSQVVILPIPGFAQTMADLLAKHGYVDRYPESFKVIAGGAIAEMVLAHLNVIEVRAPNDIDVFLVEQRQGLYNSSKSWGTHFVPLNYVGAGCNDRKIPFMSSIRDGRFNWIELATDVEHPEFNPGTVTISAEDLLESFDLNVTQAAWYGGDEVHVSQALLDVAKHRTIYRNPAVTSDSRIRQRKASKARKYGLTQG